MTTTDRIPSNLLRCMSREWHDSPVRGDAPFRQKLKGLAEVPAEGGGGINSLREALDNLDKNRDFLKKGGVFTDDMIDAYLEHKMAEVARFEMTPHPVEFDMYYSV